MHIQTRCDSKNRAYAWRRAGKNRVFQLKTALTATIGVDDEQESRS